MYMYSNYISFLQEINSKNFNTYNFKSNKLYNLILEHVSYEQGIEYSNLIMKEFPNIMINDILKYIEINDKYGNPKLYKIQIHDIIVNCSPTSLRYIYHSLIIIDHYKKTGLNKIVEVGCGYGGL